MTAATEPGRRHEVTSAYLFAQDVVDEGVDTLLDRLQGAGMNAATMAAAYHHGRDVFPHNPKHTIVYHEGGAVFYHPESRLYDATRLKPYVASIAAGADPLSGLVEAAAGRGMQTGAWVALLHNSRLSMNHPDCAPLNALGDRMLNYLCPAHPEARAYASAVVRDVARHGVNVIDLEALSYQGFNHGYHHERSFIRLSPNIRFLLGLCFCRHCLDAVARAGVDGQSVQRHVRERIEAVLRSARNETNEPDIEEQALRAEAGGELGRFLDARQQVVTSLVAEVTAAAHAASPRTKVVFLELSGGVLGYATGYPPIEEAAVTIAWRDGVDVTGVAAASDGIGALAYFADPARFEREVAAYQRILGGTGTLEVLLRPMLPDAESPPALAAKVQALRRANVDHISFYHYGFMRLESLDWIREALATDTAASGPPTRQNSEKE